MMIANVMANHGGNIGGFCPPCASGADTLVLTARMRSLDGVSGLPRIRTDIMLEGQGFSKVRASVELRRPGSPTKIGDLMSQGLVIRHQRW